MKVADPVNVKPACIVSFDVVGHSRGKNLDAQLQQLGTLNSIIRNAIERFGHENMLWASRGDGGHAILFNENQEQHALDVIIRLSKWAEINHASLRIIAHKGAVGLFHGADDRIELAGDDINLVGHIMKNIDAEEVVITKSFAKAVDLASYPEIKSQSRFKLEVDSFPPVDLTLVEIGETPRPDTLRFHRSDLTFLQRAQRTRATWDIIYYAKRLMEIDEADTAAVNALRQIDDEDLVFHDRKTRKRQGNPFLRLLRSPDRVNFIRVSQLVERGPGEPICWYGDPGDSMFIILRGSVGVILPSELESQQPKFILRPGEIVGELAFALGQPRTATLRCLSKTALLSFNPQRLDSFYARLKNRSSVRPRIQEFFDLRVLRFVCETISFLLGDPKGSPLSDIIDPWEQLLPYSKIWFWEWKDRKRFSTSDSEFRRAGLYFLLMGDLRIDGNPDAAFDGRKLPLIHVDIPDLIVHKRVNYAMDGDVKVLFIDFEGLMQFGPSVVRCLTDQLQKAPASRSLQVLASEVVSAALPSSDNQGLRPRFDAFLSHSSIDKDWASRLKKALQTRGVISWLDSDEIRPGEIVADALYRGMVESSTFVLIISPESVSSSWVQEEYNRAFDLIHSKRGPTHLIPVILRHAKLPPFVGNRNCVDFRDEHTFERNLNKLVWGITGVRPSESN